MVRCAARLGHTRRPYSTRAARGVKVVQITDLHLFSNHGHDAHPPEYSNGVLQTAGRPPTHASLSAVLDDIQCTVPDLDALVISGNMVDNGADDPAAYKVLRKELAGRELAGRTHVIPGNHDRQAPLLEAFPEWVFWSAY